MVWLDSFRADIVFGWRQLRNRGVVSAAAILSLGLAIGACTAAFQIIDALLLRPLPIAEPERLHALFREGIGPDGNPRTSDSYEYPLFRQMRAAVKDRAELIAVSYAYSRPIDVTYGSDQEMERAYRQYVSGWMFDSFGIRPALGRLFAEADDVRPGAHPYAILSHDYWTRRFGRDPKVVGRTFRIGADLYEIIGVAQERFTGVEPGSVTDIFLPTMMNASAIDSTETSWFRTLVWMKPGFAVEPVHDRLQAVFRAFRAEQAKGFTGRPKLFIDRFLNESLLLEPAAAGVSDMQKEYRQPLAALGVLVALVLLIACANVANLMTAHAAARSREMALRISIGAGRWRLVQLVLVESAWIVLLSTVLGALFARWSAPLVVRMIDRPDYPARLSLPFDWRVLGFGLALGLGVTFLFGLLPALRASAVKPASALKGGHDPHSRRRLMHGLIAGQVSFCILVLFVGGLFFATFDRLANQPTGFSADRLLTLETVVRSPQSSGYWELVGQHLRQTPGVEAVALSRWALLVGNAMNGFVSTDGTPPEEIRNHFLHVSPGWVDLMKIPFVAGRDFHASDTYPGAAIVNETFAKQHFGGLNPVGKQFEKVEGDGKRLRFQIVGLVHDARYQNMRDRIIPTVYVPFQWIESNGAPRLYDRATFIVRTSNRDPLALAPILRQDVARARAGFRVSNIRTQKELKESHTVRERLLATLAIFFSFVALSLAGVGLYGVFEYSVLQRRREIGIRMAIGAQAGGIVRLVTVNVLAMVIAGGLVGLALGVASARFLEKLLYQVKPTEFGVLALPSITILVAALLAALPAAIRAVRIDPAKMLRSE